MLSRQMVLSLRIAFRLLCAGGILLTGTANGRGDARRTHETRLVRGPRAERLGDKVEIGFVVDKATDVEVAILDTGGKVIRHLAAGLLGKNAPEPFRKNSLSQEIEWDIRDDAGNAAKGGPFAARVRVGASPKLDRLLGWDGNCLLGKIVSLRMSPQGELFVLLADPFRGRAEMRVLDADAGYLRTIIPYPADTPEKRTAPVGHIEIDGRRQPMVFNGQGHSIYPLTAGLREQTIAWHPDGYLILASAVGSMCNHGPPRFLMALHPEGGSPEGVVHIGPRIRDAGGFMGDAGEAYAMGLDRIAVSPDGEWIYVVQNFTDSYRFKKELRHGVYRLKWNQAKAEELWVGQDIAGSGDDEFNEPAGIAVDSQGRVFICDRGNNRVKVFAPNGTLLDQFPCPQPEQIELHPTSGEIVILAKEDDRKAESGKLFHFSAWKKGATKRIAEQQVSGLRCMTLDPTSDDLRLWIAYATGWRRPYGLAPVTVADGSFRIGEDINRSTSLHHPSFIVADPQRNRAIVFEHLLGSGHRSVNLKTGEVTAMKTRGSDLVMDARGNLYVMDDYNANSMSRYGPDFTPLPFSATGTNKLKLTYRAYGPGMGLRGHCVAPNGDIYVRRSPNHACVSTVDVFGSDGTLKKAGLVRGTGSADGGIGVDNRGNVYLGTNLKPADQPLPADFAAAIPAGAWKYYRGEVREAPWSYLYCNPYLFHMGSVFKFGPEGGAMYGNFGQWAKVTDPNLALDKAPAGATNYKSSYLGWDVKVVGAEWRYPGVGIIPASFDAFRGDDGCSCMVSHLDADLYGRVYAPSAFVRRQLVLPFSDN
ncbi:MAG: SMP-30/gluconolactonase/LRE family protein [Planctomycetes bacterium]|nr:SMP-30/gluconolactonase/LRE family protein [Planctomycetota bacterium]